MGNLPPILIFIIFLISAAATWSAGTILAKTTDVIDYRFKIGDALGGLIFLGIAGSLPEIAIVISASIYGRIPVIIGNLIGGLSIQTLLIVFFDYATKIKKPISYLAGSFVLSIEVLFVIFLVLLVILGSFIPEKITFFQINPISILIFLGWFLGLFIINRLRKKDENKRVKKMTQKHDFYLKKSNGYVIFLFFVASIITLVAGFFLEQSGTLIATNLGINSGIFAATILALISALPEISTGLESILIGDHQLAVSDVMGGNAFMLTLFLMAELIIRKPVLSYATIYDALLAVLAVLMMGVYSISFLKKPTKSYFNLGVDSIIVIILYFVGIFLLMYLK